MGGCLDGVLYGLGNFLDIVLLILDFCLNVVFLFQL